MPTPFCTSSRGVCTPSTQASLDLHELATTTLNDDGADLAVFPGLRDLTDALALIDAEWRAACGDVQAEWDRVVRGQYEHGGPAAGVLNNDHGADGGHGSRAQIARSKASTAVDMPPAPPANDAHGHPLGRPERRLVRPAVRSNPRPSPAPAAAPPPPASPRRLRSGKCLVCYCYAETDSSDDEADENDAEGG
ncbi:hypothetical protein AMAG_20699 [Allomyces macrogynus ATCC 38327]|uniref:Uncharacterized protein n=1 Tax=Allomyces macrogynus (strain ATCC 38327) TaxID=578462 RepID=A0A0L0TEK0_ALLM3|nr:hypothetical protein AMAG_20699 [Allomyces macrogynus ATCC 38327]|eukprot:KNE73177.1 hypothetical protein AMAG_20699 [Allomyces macrogynus ATCC 38327]